MQNLHLLLYRMSAALKRGFEVKMGQKWSLGLLEDPKDDT